MRTTRRTRDLGALSGPLIGISFIAGVGGAIAKASNRFPRPGSDAATIQRYFTEDVAAARISAAGQLVSTAALLRFTGSVARLARQSGPDSAALRAAAVTGGGGAAASLATSALCALALTRRTDPGADPDKTVALARRAFAAGGPVHGVAFGVLVASLSVAGRRTGELPGGVVRTGLGSAVAGALAPLYFVAEPAGWLIPIGRFSGFVVSGIAGVRLSRRKR